MPTTEEIAAKLNRLYFLDPDMYLRKLNALKQNGYKVLRNSKGEHKVQIDFSQSFGDIFSGLYK